MNYIMKHYGYINTSLIKTKKVKEPKKTDTLTQRVKFNTLYYKVVKCGLFDNLLT